MADGYVQANLVMLPAGDADDFQAFCQSNPIPCPLLERTPPGNFDIRQEALVATYQHARQQRWLESHPNRARGATKNSQQYCPTSV